MGNVVGDDIEPSAARVQLGAHVERARRRRAVEKRAVEAFRETALKVGVDALAAQYGWDRSTLYAEARGTRPPQFAHALGVIAFDPGAGASLLQELAAAIDCVVVPASEQGDSEVRRLFREMVELLRKSGAMTGDESPRGTAVNE